MTEPCSQEPLIKVLIKNGNETHDKLDAIRDILSVVAVQKERVDTHEGKLTDLEKRMREIEGLPFRVLVWLGSIGGALVIVVATYLLNSGG